MTYQILFWETRTQQWVDFVLRGRELSLISQKEANFLRSDSIGIEYISKVISYFADQVCWGPPSSFWKVIGTREERLPSFIDSTYEVSGQETSAPPLAATAQ